MKKKKSSWLMLILTLVFALVITGCNSSSQPASDSGGNNNTQQQSGNDGVQSQTETSTEKIKIGVIVAETGPASTLGKPEADAARLLQKELYETGPINGKEIEIVVMDYETDDTKAVVAMKRLISEHNVVAVVAATQASTTMAVREEAIESNIPLLTLAPILEHGDYVFQIPQSNEIVLSLIIDYLKKNNIDKVAWTNARDGFGQSGLPIFKELAQANGIELVAVEDFDAAATDMTVVLTKIRPQNPEAIIVWSRPPGAGIVARNAHQLGMNIPMIQSHAVANQGFLVQVGDEGEGVLVLGSKLSVIDQLPSSEYTNFLEEYRDRFQAEFGYDGGSFSGYAYDGIDMVVEAIKAGYDTPGEIKEFLESHLGEYTGISGTFNFSSERRDGPDNDGMTILEVSNGEWKYNQ